MTYVVTEPCDGCKYTDCVDVCPVEAFHEGETMLYINPETCIDCGACEEECPVEAIFEQDRLPDNFQHWLAINDEKCRDLPIIAHKKDPLPTAKPREEVWAARGKKV
ncbi:ferredoxin family protein [bacterium]|nr:ferredoxin family protein [bacterium]